MIFKYLSYQINKKLVQLTSIYTLRTSLDSILLAFNGKKNNKHSKTYETNQPIEVIEYNYRLYFFIKVNK